MDLALARSPSIPLVTLVAAGAVGAGLLTGWLFVTYGAAQTVAAMLACVAAVALLRSVWVALAGVLAVVAILPYATLPVGASVTPALLELALLAALAIGSAVLLIDRRQAIRTGGPQALALGVLGVSLFAFVLGLGRGYTTQTLHDFFKFALAIASFWIVVQMVTSPDAARWLLWLLTGVTSVASAIALTLYAGGPGLTERVLVRLVPYGYPGGRIVRFIEDDPARPMRAVGTSVDPNSFGGLLMVGFVLAVAQLLARHRTIPPIVTGGAATLTGAAMLLTYSRGAWVGAFAGVVLILLLRRAWLLAPLAGIGAAAVAAGLGSGFVERLWLGFTLQDPATKLRIDEYRNAIAIIREHPWFGVGFGDAPSIELQTGVSSIYLTIAERAGIIGLLFFLVTVAVIGWRGLAGSRLADETSDITLAFTAALAAALTVGLVDHYFYNPQFPQMATLFWVICGAIVAVTTTGFASDQQRVSSTEKMQRPVAGGSAMETGQSADEGG